MAILVTRLATAVSSPKTPKMAINRDFPGLRAFSANVGRDKNDEQEIPHPMVKSILEPLKSGYGHFSHPAGHGRFKPKNTQNGNKSQFPGATCIFSKCCERQKRRARNSASDGQNYRAFWSPQNRLMAILVTRLATAVSSPKTPKMAINRDFPGLRAFSANVARDKNEGQEIPHPMVKIILEPLKSSYGHFSHPAGHGRFKPKNTQNGNKSRFPGATCIFSKCWERQKRRARNSASDGQKYFGAPKIELWPF